MTVLFFCLLSKFCTVFHSGCINLYSYQEGLRVSFLHILASIWYFLFLTLSNWVKDESSCISLMNKDVQHFSNTYWPLALLLRSIFLGPCAFLIGLLVFWNVFGYSRHCLLSEVQLIEIFFLFLHSVAVPWLSWFSLLQSKGRRMKTPWKEWRCRMH